MQRHNFGFILPICLLILFGATTLLILLSQQVRWQISIKKNYHLQQSLVRELQAEAQRLLVGEKTANSLIIHSQDKIMGCEHDMDCLHQLEIYLLQHVERSNFQLYIAIGQKLSGLRSILDWHLMYH